MVFKQWIQQKHGRGGPKVVADFLGVSVKTIYAWCHLARFPRSTGSAIATLRAVPDLDVAQWQREYTQHKLNEVSK